MRVVAFSFLAWSAFDLPTWHIDRLGVALLGFGFAVLAAIPARAYTPAMPGTRSVTVTAPDDSFALSAERMEQIIRAAS